ncbi:response regulator [Bacillus sp. JJ664]
MGNESILMVEDEEKLLRLLDIELEYEGYKVTKSTNGLEAFDTYRTKQWDLILLDVMLPGIPLYIYAIFKSSNYQAIFV